MATKALYDIIVNVKSWCLSCNPGLSFQQFSPLLCLFILQTVQCCELYCNTGCGSLIPWVVAKLFSLYTGSHDYFFEEDCLGDID